MKAMQWFVTIALPNTKKLISKFPVFKNEIYFIGLCNCPSPIN
jgi:hypothetical protein